MNVPKNKCWLSASQMCNKNLFLNELASRITDNHGWFIDRVTLDDEEMLLYSGGKYWVVGFCKAYPSVTDPKGTTHECLDLESLLDKIYKDYKQLSGRLK